MTSRVHPAEQPAVTGKSSLPALAAIALVLLMSSHFSSVVRDMASPLVPAVTTSRGVNC